MEICGVLVGQWERDADGPFVSVTESIRCDVAASRSGEVTFTHEAWNAINREMDTRLAGLKIVGWYHSHPSFGIFLSERDVFIQQHFFSNPGQVAYVVDPLRKMEGVFVWRNGKPKPLPHYWVGSRIHLSAGADDQGEQPPAGRPPAPASEAGAGMGDLISWPAAIRAAMMYVLVFLIGYLLAGMRTAREQAMLTEGAVAHYGLWKGLRPGLRENLDEVDEHLEKISQVVVGLSKEHVDLAGEDASEKKDQWKQTLDALRQVRLFLRQVNAKYSLTPEESAVIERLILAKEAELMGVREKAAAKGDAAKAGGAAKADTKAKPPDQTEKPAGAAKAEEPAKNDRPKPPPEKGPVAPKKQEQEPSPKAEGPK